MKPVTLVTGASSGLGRELAKLLCKEGHIIYATARRKKKLNELKQQCADAVKDCGCEEDRGEVRVIAGDLTAKKFRKKLIKKVIKKSGRLDYLINNAGYGTLIQFEYQTLKDIEKMFELNIIAVMDLTRQALPHMKKHGRGRIINISSVAAFDPPPYFASYNATKFAIHGFTKSLRYELKNTGVSASAVFPARMKTPFWNVAFRCYGLKGKKKKQCYEKWTKGASTADKVAKRIVRKLDSRRLIILPNILSKLSYHLLRHFKFISTLYMSYVMEPNSRKKVVEKFNLKKNYKANT